MPDSITSLEPSRLPVLTTQIVSAYVRNNRVATESLSVLIESVHHALSAATGTARAPAAKKTESAVPIRKSVFPDHIVCLEDGKKMKMLKRHLKAAYNMTPQQYRKKWGLPADYPMVAPAYASRRSELAKSIGLGRKPAEPKVEKLPARRARGSRG